MLYLYAYGHCTGDTRGPGISAVRIIRDLDDLFIRDTDLKTALTITLNNQSPFIEPGAYYTLKTTSHIESIVNSVKEGLESIPKLAQVIIFTESVTFLNMASKKEKRYGPDKLWKAYDLASYQHQIWYCLCPHDKDENMRILKEEAMDRLNKSIKSNNFLQESWDEF